MRVYVETTVWSFAFADDSPDYRAATLAFFDECRRGRFSTLTSPPVFDEVLRSEEPKRSQLSKLIVEINPTRLAASDDADRLAGEFVRLGAVPPSKPIDAAHVAYAFLAQADVLVSWNFKHITNVRRSQKFNAAASLFGFQKPLIITTPSEILYGDEPA